MGLFALWPLLAQTAAAANTPPLLPKHARRSVVFSPGECDTSGECYPYFRIPALKRAKSGALLAFVEARGGHSGSSSDHGDVQIVVRRSEDGSGANGTWGAIYKVASEAKHTIGNPAPVVDMTSGIVFCHFARDNFDAFVTKSTDEGKTWSNRTALDTGVKVPGSGWYGSGVGGGTQLPDGRLLILSEERKGFCADLRTRCKPCNRSDNCLTTAYNAVPVYSDNGGRSWQRGRFLPVLHNATTGPGEPSVALLGNSSLDLVMSGRGADHRNSYSISHNGGLDWSETTVISALDSPGCQSPITGMYHGAGVLLTSPVGKTRSNLSLFHASAASGLTDWNSLGTLWAGQAGYSSLLAARSLISNKTDGVVTPPGSSTVDYFVLFEGGYRSSFEFTMLIGFSVGLSPSSNDQHVFNGSWNGTNMRRRRIKSDDDFIASHNESTTANVLGFGAIGNGVTDDTDAFEAALSAATDVPNA